jgi:hypothetical protein
MFFTGLGSYHSNQEDFDNSTYVAEGQSLIVVIPLAQRYRIQAIGFDYTPVDEINGFPIIARAMIRRGQIRNTHGWIDPIYTERQIKAFGGNLGDYNEIYDRDAIWQTGISSFGTYYFDFGVKGLSKGADKFITALITPAYRADVPITYREAVNCMRSISVLGEEV